MISVVVPARDAEKTLSVLLRSVRESGFKDVELIVVDDASTDSTVEVAERFGAKTVLLEKRSGPAVARNAGARIARGEILLFLDSDVRLYPETLGYINARFKEEQELNCLVGIYSKKPLNSGFFPMYKALFNYFLFKDARGMESFETSCGAIRRNVFEEIGGFDTDYRGAEVEDYELGYRLGAKYKVVLDKDIQVDHYYPVFLSNAKNFFHRGRLWLGLFFKRRRFDSAGGTTLAQAVCTIAALPLLLAFVYTIFLGRGACILLIFAGVYLVLNGRFFIYCLKEKGFGFSLLAVLVHFANSIVILAAVGAALFSFMRGKT